MAENIDFDKLLKTSDAEFATTIKNGPEVLKELQVHQYFEETKSLLTHAVGKGEIRKTELLIELGANPNDQPQNLILLALFGSRGANQEMFELLLSAGVVYPTEKRECQIMIEQFPSLLRKSPLLIDRMIESGFDPKATEQNAKTSILLSIIEGVSLSRDQGENSVTYIKKMITHGCSTKTLAEDYPMDEGLLYHAIGLRAFGTILSLKDHGANITEKSIPDVYASLARRNSDIDKDILATVMDVFPHLDFTVEDGYGVLHCACCHGNIQLVDYLLEHGFDINSVAPDGNSCLTVALEWGEGGLAPLLLKRGIDVNIANKNGDTALDIASRDADFKRVCTQLKKAGALTGIELNSDSPDLHRAMLDQLLDKGEPWAQEMFQAIIDTPTDLIPNWITLINHCIGNRTSKPSKLWLAQASELVEEIGVSEFVNISSKSLGKVNLNRTHVLNVNELYRRMDNPNAEQSLAKEWTIKHYNEARQRDEHRGEAIEKILSEQSQHIIKGLVWLAAEFSDKSTSRALRTVAACMYKKISGKGMRDAKLANAALMSLSSLPNDDGLPEIVALRASIKYVPALKNIDRVFARLASERGVEPDELATSSVPDYDLSDIGFYEKAIGECKAQIAIGNSRKAELIWFKKGKAQKSVPAILKPYYSDEIKEIKALVEELDTAIGAHTTRIEQFYLSPTELSFSDWSKNYCNHPLIGTITRCLIWSFKSKGTSVNAIYSDGIFTGCDGKERSIDEEADVELWHPIQSTDEETQAWRRWLIASDVTQPFKQAHRETYVITDAEREAGHFSDRFSGHILKLHQFHALASQRLWNQQRGGDWDGGDHCSADKEIPSYGYEVNFSAYSAEGLGISDSGIYLYVNSSRVSFSGKTNLLEEVEPVVFSEVMRDVDLFVSVCSIGNDPQWTDPENNYWQQSSFGKLSEVGLTRKNVLENIIPKLAISSRLKIDGRNLIVDGNLRKYRIHLGTSNIQILPSYSYLCIVGVNNDDKVMLPFAGDHTLSLIISKAIFLANDDKIKDSDILSQMP